MANIDEREKKAISFLGYGWQKLVYMGFIIYILVVIGSIIVDLVNILVFLGVF